MNNALKRCSDVSTTTSKMSLQIIDNLATAVLLFDNNLKLRFINGAAEDLLLISYKRVKGKTLKQIWPTPSCLYKAIQRALFSGTTCIERGVDLILNIKQVIKVDCMITPIIVDDKAEEILLELINIDMIIRVMQEARQQSIQKTAKESIQGIAHEIKNPLGGIRGAAQLLERELNADELREYTQIIINESDRLRKFIDRMLTTSNMPVKSRFNIHELLEYVDSVVRAENTDELNITKDYDPSIPDINADRAQIIQVLLNLMRNAVEAINKNGSIKLKTRIRQHVTIQHTLNRDVVELSIIDDGPGVPEEIEADVFYPMVTGWAGGTGLGLSIAQQLIQSHGGLINYERRENETCFNILLPIEPDHD